MDDISFFMSLFKDACRDNPGTDPGSKGRREAAFFDLMEHTDIPGAEVLAWDWIQGFQGDMDTPFNLYTISKLFQRTDDKALCMEFIGIVSSMAVVRETNEFCLSEINCDSYEKNFLRSAVRFAFHFGSPPEPHSEIDESRILANDWDTRRAVRLALHAVGMGEKSYNPRTDISGTAEDVLKYELELMRGNHAVEILRMKRKSKEMIDKIKEEYASEVQELRNIRKAARDHGGFDMDNLAESIRLHPTSQVVKTTLSKIVQGEERP